MSTLASSYHKASLALADWAPLPIRLAVGYGFMAHGYAKFSRGPEKFAAVLHTLGVPEPLLAAWAATLTELIGGAAVMAGVLIPWVSIPMVIVLLTALVTVHLPYGFFSVKFAEVTEAGIKFGSVGYEILLLYLAGLITLVLSGPGALSLERWIERRQNRCNSQQVEAANRNYSTVSSGDRYDVTDP